MAKKVSKIKGEIKCHNHTTACYSLLIDFIISAFFSNTAQFLYSSGLAWSTDSSWTLTLRVVRLAIKTEWEKQRQGEMTGGNSACLNDMMLRYCSLAHSVYLGSLLQLFGEKCSNVTRPGNATGIPTKCSLAFLIGFQPNKSDWSSLKSTRLMGLLHILLDFLLL